MRHGKDLYTLIPPAKFRELLALDEREDALSRSVLGTATAAIEHYCHRRLLKKKCQEYLDYTGVAVFPLQEYPVREILAVYLSHASIQPELVEPDFYHTVPDCDVIEESDLWSAPFYLSISPGVRMIRGMSVLKIHYWAGYRVGEVPEDLAGACMELADWNMKRIKGGKIGVAGAAPWKGQRSSGLKSDGEHLEVCMPEHVRELLEPYRRHFL
jgi:hypothetical protein